MCWLCPEDSGPFPAPFIRKNDEDLERFTECLNTMYGTTDSVCCIETAHTTYFAILDQSKELFDFDGRMMKPTNPLHKKLKGDLTRTVGKMRRDFNLPNMQTSPRDLAIDMLGRILIYADMNGIKYRQGFADILLVIVHIVFYGLLAFPETPELLQKIDAPDARFQLVESFSADIFVKFMSVWPIRHMFHLPPTLTLESLCDAFMKRISDNSLEQWIKREAEMNIPGGFLLRWIITLFTHDLPFEEVLKIWDWLFKKVRDNSYITVLISLCAAVAMMKSKEVKDKAKSEIMHEMQNLGHLGAAAITKCADTLIQKKGNVDL